MSDLTDEQLRGVSGRSPTLQAMATELLALRAERAKLETALRSELARDSDRCDIVADSNYAAGMLLGWNLCFDGKDEEHNRIRGERMHAAAKASKAIAALKVNVAPNPADALRAGMRAELIEATAELIYLRQYGKDGAVWWANESKDVWRDKAALKGNGE